MPTTAPSTTVVPLEESGGAVTSDDAGATEVAPVPLSASTVRIDVSTPVASAELAANLAESVDPFGQFVSCAGLRDVFGPYSVLASSPGGDVRSISVLSADLVRQPGIHDAAVRVEFAAAPPIDAIGTVTIADDYRSGSYVAFGLDGEQVEGTFDCGGPATPRPVTVGDTDAVLEAVEVFALLRDGDAQRVVGLAADAGGEFAIECSPVGDAETDEPVVRAVGDERLGAITEFDLVGGSSAQLRIVVGAMAYDFDDVEVGDADSPAAGTFTASAGGVTVDGAFRCS